jgi:hypothetical protein
MTIQMSEGDYFYLLSNILHTIVNQRLWLNGGEFYRKKYQFTIFIPYCIQKLVFYTGFLGCSQVTRRKKSSSLLCEKFNIEFDLWSFSGLSVLEKICSITPELITVRD